MRTTGMQVPPGESGYKSIQALLRDFSRERDWRYESCLDIGCGRSRYDRWFGRFEYAAPPRRYIGVDSDAEIVSELASEGLDVRMAGEEQGDCAADLTLCLEIIEHLPPEETPAFLDYAARNTRRMLALTTPNCEYWAGGNFRQNPDYRECRWIPDHAPSYRPSGGPHHHKQLLTPQMLSDYLSAALPSETWRHQVFRAWPWRLEDLATGHCFDLYFKLFALAWRIR